ncbi:tail spike protein [Salmonella phage vB_SalP_TR2]|uniref:Tail spike protein n=1 Tax=Salmonella phage vB_SalP_TR2 TaxID=2812854 RepID=A0A898KAQ9_9CAUD|nr:tail spike protein [Salmonella phage vB_SalP_TR2]QSJ04043.1 tail spike protein [Salmonella phage vB_SalP_TR2]
MKSMFAQDGSGSAGIKTNKQVIARHFGVQQSEVCYVKPSQPLTGPVHQLLNS